MPKREGRDFAVNALRIVEQAIGEHIDGSPLIEDSVSKMPSAVSRGKKGGKARASNLPAAKRKEIASRAANARWGRASS
jgi:hypothetical protein